MSRKDKLIKKLKSKPKNMTFDEVSGLLSILGFRVFEKGKTSGSRIMFKNDSGCVILIHKPHPNKEMPYYQIKLILEQLLKEGLI